MDMDFIRYDWYTDYDGFTEMVKRSDGDYVRYDDAVAERDALRAEVERLKKKVIRTADDFWYIRELEKSNRDLEDEVAALKAQRDADIAAAVEAAKAEMYSDFVSRAGHGRERHEGLHREPDGVVPGVPRPLRRPQGLARDAVDAALGRDDRTRRKT